MLIRILRPFLPLLYRIAARLVSRADEWDRFYVQVGSRKFGREAPTDWKSLLAQPSDIVVSSKEEVFAFLMGCRSTATGHPDVARPWPALTEFERLRAGDCTAHAAWAWGKLVQLGVDADLVVGRVIPFERPDAPHAWVLFRDDGREYLLESVAKEEETLVRPLDTVRERYRPEIGVDVHGTRFAFAGGMLSLRDGHL